ncbi:MAG: hypothetical protein C4541_02975 [Candidatus Auribacter fodinae]|uniref:DUF4015 domain-containing protein n=1 Tax=Candidatus Auribacter fodinae TaxID=2093366 RepID=A0A3A4R963_9BACT|nr:MAG: hypothetical protein C4541_02975 [Candidatus Auribacter fodinae]
MNKGISYFGSRLPEHVFPDLKKIKDATCTYVVHTFSEEDMMFYRGNMKSIVAETKKLGMKAHIDPWGVAGLFGGETFSYYVARELGVRQVTSEGRLAPLACLNNPEARNFMRSWVDAAVEIGADSIFWDEPHFYVPGWFGFSEPKSEWGCRCGVCKKMYRDMYGEELPETMNPQVIAFQDECLISFLTEMCAYTAEKGCENTVCMLPNEEVRDSGFWRRVGSIKHISSFGTDPYWIPRKKADPKFNMDSFLRPFCREVRYVAETNNIGGHIWIQNFHIPAGWEPDIEQVASIAVEEGITDLTAWTFYGAKGMSSLCADQPEKVWETLARVYSSLG